MEVSNLGTEIIFPSQTKIKSTFFCCQRAIWLGLQIFEDYRGGSRKDVFLALSVKI